MDRTETLVVDDCRMTCLLLRYVLDQEDISAETAADGSEALEKVESNNFRLVFLDIMLPGLSGLDVARRIRAMPLDPQPRIVFMTSMGEMFRKEMVEDFEPSAVLFKPLAPSEVTALATRLLEAAHQPMP